MKRIAWILICVVVLCSCQTTQPLSRDTFAMDTSCTVTIYAGGDEALLDECVRLLSRREALWSRTVTGSDVARLNAANGNPCVVDAATAALLTKAATFSSQTDGAFDVTSLPLTLAWKTAEADGVVPTAQQLETAMQTVDAANIRIDGTNVTLQNGALIDLGGIAKGQAADDVAALLKNGGCTSALIVLGGNVVVIGEKPNGEAFHIGIADPTNADKLAAQVAVRDCSVVTSGSYERVFTVAGKRYSHIVDTKTGQPVQNDLLSVTILCTSSVQADALSTACFVMGFDKAKAFIESLDGTEAVFVKQGGEVVATAGVTLV